MIRIVTRNRHRRGQLEKHSRGKRKPKGAIRSPNLKMVMLLRNLYSGLADAWSNGTKWGSHFHSTKLSLLMLGTRECFTSIFLFYQVNTPAICHLHNQFVEHLVRESRHRKQRNRRQQHDKESSKLSRKNGRRTTETITMEPIKRSNCFRDFSMEANDIPFSAWM